jgi:hypothetical protein
MGAIQLFCEKTDLRGFVDGEFWERIESDLGCKEVNG